MNTEPNRTALLAVGLAVALSGCTCSDQDEPRRRERLDRGTFLEQSTGQAPRALFLPDAAAVAASGRPPLPGVISADCPADMVSIAGRFCIDRFEASLVDTDREREVSPFYHPTQRRTQRAYEVWQNDRLQMGPAEMRELPLPEPPAFQLREPFDVRAVSRRGVTPNGYLSGVVAQRACENAGKRLCTEEEWVMACRGEQDRKFPYGDEYQAGVCNVKAGVHPAAVLHGSASIGHLDPRLNQFSYRGRTLLHVTGANPECASTWGDDAVYDMVGNLDEWIADDEGVFLGGFYARNTVQGCESKITAHPRAYFDYSLGVRCCK